MPMPLPVTRERSHGNSNETPLLNTDATPYVERNAEPINGRKTASKRTRLENETVRQYVMEKLALGWSPELIAGRLTWERIGFSISYEAIYQYIYQSETAEPVRN